jgi:hypothetical protein
MVNREGVVMVGYFLFYVCLVRWTLCGVWL